MMEDRLNFNISMWELSRSHISWKGRLWRTLRDSWMSLHWRGSVLGPRLSGRVAYVHRGVAQEWCVVFYYKPSAGGASLWSLLTGQNFGTGIIHLSAHQL